MVENVDLSLVDWSRAQFAMTAAYHWLFVPLTLGLSFIMAVMETFYYRTGDEKWRVATKFWMKLFAINFAIGVATGIILEFEFGTNWSNYSWFVGDIFGAPLAIEGIFAFFLEATFFAVMFFGWNKVSKKAHLVSTWMVAFGTSLSALWILVANAWMQYPAGMHFNPDMGRNEMQSISEVIFSPIAINKFFHSVLSGWMLAGIFVAGVSSWFLIKKRETEMALRSLKIAAIIGLIGTFAVILTGDFSSRLIAKYQPMKFAATEALHEGTTNAPLTVFGIPHQDKATTCALEIPSLLSFMTYSSSDAYVAGIKDLVDGNEEQGILSGAEKIERGKVAREVLRQYHEAKKNKDEEGIAAFKAQFGDEKFQNEYFKYFGYGFLNDAQSLVPNVPVAFWSFRVMVALGLIMGILFVLILLGLKLGWFEKKHWLPYALLFSIPLPYIAGEAGWVVAEMGRQPWSIQDYLPTVAAVSQISASSVQVTFWLFVVLFTSLAIAEVSILCRQIKKGPSSQA